ncbi:LuxR C-terminal-related transcriptional regulator [Streptomyces bacillaris]|uniref:Helix-turn-helix transcriptional regulator n=1 Tax=Streptomyces cavourensis TaxID=67258 RepID=A0AAD0Q4N0_9ACTN|nr:MULTISPECIES: LuxR C-terminal-related transcriptional regulator [Streptomyces]AXI72134.1 helix-turn-helix transcriptional regulator [Streptomyces cavourensis]NUV39435.1 helix-turn-helix transcriptional regulator [Streptomyces sp. CAI-24]NUV79544.1 helix-turn-helix transcriptional regulator [Streptomyces sp. CAI-155]UTR82535.1 LuxR C-terminal-related transcriptional regulator [Streptomyces cavourensis]WAE66690.1 LuxR C-terminal-related transcriptional regulator [Streptomyces cavourensis]
MLGRLGIGPDEEAVYRVMLKDGPGAVAGLVEALGWPEERARSALDRLAALSLVRPSADGGPGRPVDPEVGLASLLAGQETELLEKERQIRASRIAMAGLLADIRATGQGVSEVQKLRSMDQIQSKIEHLAGTCTSEIAAFVPGGGQSEEHLEAARPLDTSTSDRGVRLRYIFLDSCRNSPATREYVAWLGERGGLVRTVPRLPLRMLIYDRSRAIVPMDATAADQGALVLDGTGALTGLLALFEQTWQQAKPLGESAAEAAAGQGGPLSPPERAVLDLLTEGFTDEAIARQLGVSVRTVRRVTADLMHRLGARSRFEAGVLATTKGWVTV